MIQRNRERGEGDDVREEMRMGCSAIELSTAPRASVGTRVRAYACRTLALARVLQSQSPRARVGWATREDQSRTQQRCGANADGGKGTCRGGDAVTDSGNGRIQIRPTFSCRLLLTRLFEASCSTYVHVCVLQYSSSEASILIALCTTATFVAFAAVGERATATSTTAFGHVKLQR
jgi:hypothetical protein